MASTFDVSGRTALVTGASSGLGQHFALTLVRADTKVVLAARRRERLEALAKQIRSEGGQAFAVTMDVTDAASVRQAFEAGGNAFGPITVVVNNAGIVTSAPALELTQSDWEAVVDTNLTGAWLVAQEAARRMVAADAGGSIINIASVLALRVAGHTAHYAASKAGLMHLTRALALEWARHDIRVNAIAPGYIETDLNRGYLASAAGQTMIKRIPQRRAGKPEDLDGALLLLASDASRYITGSTIVVDGGQLQSTL
ncbi:MAG: SDR family NAD(P)-dependent oxidoreductase [Acidiferrobacterales bacterium]